VQKFTRILIRPALERPGWCQQEGLYGFFDAASVEELIGGDVGRSQQLGLSCACSDVATQDLGDLAMVARCERTAPAGSSPE